MNIDKSTFIITGGGSGLGKATALLFSKSGANVVLADLKKDTAEKVAQEIGDKAKAIECNVTDEKQVQASVDLAIESFGGLNGAINCAGVGIAQRVAGKDGPHSLSAFKFVIEVNLVGSFNMIRLAASAMTKLDPDEKGERGVFVNTASAAAFEGQIGQAAYSASKGGLVAMTLPIARELARFGIRCVTIAPGLFDTPMMGAAGEEANAILTAQVPYPARLGRAPEYASLAKQIVENSMLNGTTLRLDGALRLQPK